MDLFSLLLFAAIVQLITLGVMDYLDREMFYVEYDDGSASPKMRIEDALRFKKIFGGKIKR